MATPVHREAGRFTIQVDLSAEFDASYEGEADGYVWLADWKDRVRPRLVKAVYDVLRAHPDFRVVPGARGADPEDTVEIAVDFRPRATPSAD